MLYSLLRSLLVLLAITVPSFSVAGESTLSSTEQYRLALQYGDTSKAMKIAQKEINTARDAHGPRSVEMAVWAVRGFLAGARKFRPTFAEKDKSYTSQLGRKELEGFVKTVVDSDIPSDLKVETLLAAGETMVRNNLSKVAGRRMAEQALSIALTLGPEAVFATNTKLAAIVYLGGQEYPALKLTESFDQLMCELDTIPPQDCAERLLWLGVIYAPHKRKNDQTQNLIKAGLAVLKNNNISSHLMVDSYVALAHFYIANGDVSAAEAAIQQALGAILPGQDRRAELYDEHEVSKVEVMGKPGSVDVHYDINEMGKVVNTKIVKQSGDETIADAFLSMIKWNRYMPKIVDGTPQRVDGFQTRFEVSLQKKRF